jgi:UDP:flavonoid glycosyltransferase YjiC (YdhE family)
MVVLPIFWDQHDNAQRLAVTGYGASLDTYAFDPPQLPATIDRLLADADFADRLATLSRHLQSARGTERAADLIERAVTTG